jgi:hypothetical protein
LPVNPRQSLRNTVDSISNAPTGIADVTTP